METNNSIDSQPTIKIKHNISNDLVDIVVMTNNIDVSKAKTMLYYILKYYEYKYMSLNIIYEIGDIIYICFNCGDKSAQQEDVDYVIDYIQTTLNYNLDTII